MSYEQFNQDRPATTPQFQSAASLGGQNAPTNEPALSMEMQALTNAISELGIELDALRHHLEPVMVPVPPEATGARDSAGPSRGVVVDALATMSERVGGLRYQILGIRKRLTV